ncbi:MAG: RNase adapter RapZ, partial [Candidatus Limnocylindrales bacterium]
MSATPDDTGPDDTGPDDTGPGDTRLGDRAQATPPAPGEPSHVVIVSGLSGGGKTAAAKLFEDLEYVVVDNLPAELLPNLADLVTGDRVRYARVAIVLDVRAGDAETAYRATRGALEGRGIRPQVFFLEARDEVLIRRFSETRHRHPLGEGRG